MGLWTQYVELGIWGLWQNYFQSPYSLKIAWEDAVFCFSSVDGSVKDKIEAAQVFHWESGHGLTLSLHSDESVGQEQQDFWNLLLRYESAKSTLRPTFIPFPLNPQAEVLETIVRTPPALFLITGQPGVGKRSLLQNLCLFHLGKLPQLDTQTLIRWKVQEIQYAIIAEVAMLEVETQQALVREAAKGQRVWGATAYDTEMLVRREILLPAFVRLFEKGRAHLPPVSQRDTTELNILTGFWRAFYGELTSVDLPNMGFLKKRALREEGLSVDSILEEGRGLRGVVAQFEQEAIRQAYHRVGKSQHKIARLLKVSRGSLQHKLRKYQLESYASSNVDTDYEENSSDSK